MRCLSPALGISMLCLSQGIIAADGFKDKPVPKVCRRRPSPLNHYPSCFCAFCLASVKGTTGDFSYVHIPKNASTTEKLIAFQDNQPLADTHIQIIPNRHIGSILDLEENEQDIALLRSLMLACKAISEHLGIHASKRRMGFHIPPHNSVHHLHLHCIGLPLRHLSPAPLNDMLHHHHFTPSERNWFAPATEVLWRMETGQAPWYATSD